MPTTTPNAPHATPIAEFATALGTDVQAGLTAAAAGEKLTADGPNTIEQERKRSIWLMLWAQFKSPIVLLLVVAAGLSFGFKEWLDGIAILVVIAINAAIGFYMEFQAELSMNALKRMSAVPAKVVRDGKVVEIDATQLVAGDLLFLEAGDMVPADARIADAAQLQADESALTGESLPADKLTDPLPETTVLAERVNMVHKGTFITKGNGHAVVTATGMRTELGKIAGMVSAAERAATPLEKKLEAFSRKLIWLTLGLVVLIFIAGLLNGQQWFEMLETSIALAVAAIPEGLPIVATMALAQGMLRMARQQVIVKRLSAVETLGGTSVICTDKTGTLTQNRIEVTNIVTAGYTLDLQADAAAKNDPRMAVIRQVAILCNTAELHKEGEAVKEIGDPLEVGLLKFADSPDAGIEAMRAASPKLREEPFSSETKIMATLHAAQQGFTVYAKGAAEEVIKRSTTIDTPEGAVAMDEALRSTWTAKAEELAAQGIRMIGAAYRTTPTEPAALAEELVFAGLIGMVDPPREEVKAAIAECHSAGINVVMVTGDHPSTALNIAKQLGIATDEETAAINGSEMAAFDSLDEAEKDRWAASHVFARVSPGQKLDLIAVLQDRQQVVGMTGDGVNDAPALKKSDIGIAMGLRGTQVAQDVADMVLKDDSFTSIVYAIREGRIIFDNIRKVVIYLLSCNLSELLIIATASVLGLHFQLFALQILFINLVTDVLPALALGVVAGNPNIMKLPPRSNAESIIDRKHWIAIGFYSVVISIVTIGAVFVSHNTVHRSETWNPELCNNILFFTLIFSQLLHVLNMHASGTAFFRTEVFRSPRIWIAMLASALIVVGLYAIPVVRTALSIHPLSMLDWVIVAGAALTSLLIIRIGRSLKLIHQ
ncbi:MAG: cation-translocating P-type ATPase [Flavobacteriales bacterium]